MTQTGYLKDSYTCTLVWACMGNSPVKGLSPRAKIMKEDEGCTSLVGRG